MKKNIFLRLPVCGRKKDNSGLPCYYVLTDCTPTLHQVNIGGIVETRPTGTTVFIKLISIPKEVMKNGAARWRANIEPINSSTIQYFIPNKVKNKRVHNSTSTEYMRIFHNPILLSAKQYLNLPKAI
jgi:hypothetical protein